MFLQTWKKYLPVIVLLMKRSGKTEQVLDIPIRLVSAIQSHNRLCGALHV